MTDGGGDFGFRISAQQRFFWAMGGHDPTSTPLLIARVSTADKPSVIRDSFHRLVVKHEVLRTRYVQLPDRRTLVQVIEEQPSVSWLEGQGSSAASGKLNETVARIRTRHSRSREQESSILQCSLAPLKEGGYLLAVSAPLLSCDPVTLFNLVSGLAAELCGKTQTIEPLQYCDFSEWQYAQLEADTGSILQAQSKWEKFFDSSDSELLLRFERKRSGLALEPQHEPSELEVPLGDSILASIQELSRAERVHAREVLFQCWRVLLWRYGGEQSGAWLGRIHTGREMEELRGSLGMFARWTAHPLDLDKESTLSSLLRNPVAEDGISDTEALVRVMEAHQELLGRTVDFEYLEIPALEAAWELLHWECPLKPSRLALRCTDVGGSILPKLVWPAHAFEAADIARFASSFQTLVKNACQHPQRSIRALDLIANAPVSTNRPIPAATSVPDICDLIARAERNSFSECAAVEHEAFLTWEQLLAKARMFASWLLESGATPESVVALVLERSLDAVAALLGALKAGCVYAPIDPALPPARIASYLKQISPFAVICSDGLAIPENEGVKNLCLPSGWDLAGAAGQSETRVVPTPAQLAYMVFTSGSTGEPKVVGVTRGGISNYVDFIVRELSSALPKGSTRPRFAMVTTFSADLGNTALFGSLACGGVLHLVPKDVAMDPVLLGNYLEAHQVNVLKTVPSHLRALTEIARHQITSLLWLICGGEALDWQLLSRVREIFPRARIMNHYGPTETTVGSLVCPCGPELVLDSRIDSVPIGVPIANTDALVMNESFAICPPWVPGEIYLAGAGVARGYIGRPDLTASSFIPNAFMPGRMYRTGDLGLRLPDGKIAFLGRKDNQVKLRGYRVELSEVEHAMLGYPGVFEACAIVLQPDTPSARLGAGFVSSSQISLSGLRAYLRERLAEHMVPASLVPLETLPLTANGKIDRSQVAKILTARSEEAESQELHNQDLSWVEEIVAGIWKELLSVGTVRPDDNFFELGGHSLVGTQLIARIRESFRTEIAVRTLFEMPVLRDFAREVQESLSNPAGAQWPPIVPVPRTGAMPLSFSQQRLWFIEQMRLGEGVYNCSASLRISGPLNSDALQRAFLDVITRHEVLRTSFPSEGGSPQQTIHGRVSWALAIDDYSALPEGVRVKEAMNAVARDASEPFDLSKPPLFRVALRRLDKNDHILDICIHHIISDAWSMGILIRDLTIFYQQQTGQKSDPLSPLPVQYVDFSAWQRQPVVASLLAQEVVYWRKQLQDAPGLDLPTDAFRPALRAGRGAQLPLQLSRELSDSVNASCREHGVSSFMCLLAAWQLVLARYSAQEDVVVGFPVAGRIFGVLEHLAGCFINMLPLRTRFSPDMSVRKLLEQLRQACLGAYANQHLPFEKLVSEVALERDISRSPLFQTILNFHNTPQPSFAVADLEASWLPMEVNTSRFELELNMWRTNDGLRGALVYDAELFRGARIQRMISHFLNLLHGMAEGPDCPVESLSLMSQTEREQVLALGCPLSADYPADRCIHELFTEIACTFPQNVAVSCGDIQLTYAELEDRASLLAEVLLQQGVEREDIVAVCLGRSVEAIVSFIAILKIGAAYLPVDVDQPFTRLEYIFSDSKAVLAITLREHAQHLPSIPHLVCIDELSETPSHRKDGHTRVARACSPQNLAYVMYTSGSTGSPKAVAVNHRGVVRLVKNTNYATLSEQTIMLQFAHLGFDPSTFEIWGALLHGGRLEVFASKPWSARDLGAFISSKGINTLWLTSPVFERMVDDEISAFAQVGQIVAGGDVVPFEAARKILNQYPGITLINGYGPTENTTFTSAHVMNSPAQLGANTVPIGKPIANSKVYVLDGSLKPVPEGVPGELYAAGDGMARGYASHPELTAVAFLPIPFAGEAGERMYRTGDRVCWRDDGTLEFLGRTDHQLKLRAYRIEPREIEQALMSHPEIRDALVMAKGEGSERRLIAFIVCAVPGAEPGAAELRQHLKLRVPEYMVPSSFVVVDQFPLNSSGKHDYAALARVPEVRPAPVLHEAPRKQLEIEIAEVWKQILGIEQVNIHSNFFEAGGDSLMIVKLHNRLERHLGVELSVVELFRNPTIAALAKTLSGQNTNRANMNAAAAERAERRKRAAGARRHPNTASSTPF